MQKDTEAFCAALAEKQRAAPPPTPELVPAERAAYSGLLTASAPAALSEGARQCASEAVSVPALSDGAPAVPCLLITPPGGGAGLPCLVYYHGGGWVKGSPQPYEWFTRELAAGAGCVVLSADYRLAPEHKAPCAAEDAAAVLLHALRGGLGPAVDSARVAVAGDSAGGNLAAAAALRAKEDGLAAGLRLQLLLCPVLDARGWVSDGPPYPSRAEHAEGRLLWAASMRHFVQCYAPSEEARQDPRVSPLTAPALGGLPRAVVVTASHDVLRDEGEAYHAALAAAGTPSRYRCFEGQCHVFWMFAKQLGPASSEAIAEFTRELRSAFSP
eukprot:TRINITY_DN34644_c0_g1_i2.p1 TRINITY_DN34644_c0_g1~~TRINITY_DN34644_c0_g1_i2.p1  ORF type:complete len:353 (+),score=113.89 TRINITY_DN34644_c0_g1_i2:77-1060(+)